MSRLQKWSSFSSELMLRSRSSWTRWRQSLTQARLRRRLARVQKRLRLLEQLHREQQQQAIRLEQELHPPQLTDSQPLLPPEMQAAMDEHLRRVYGPMVTEQLAQKPLPDQETVVVPVVSSSPEPEEMPDPRLVIAQELGLMPTLQPSSPSSGS